MTQCTEFETGRNQVVLCSANNYFLYCHESCHRHQNKIFPHCFSLLPTSSDRVAMCSAVSCKINNISHSVIRSKCALKSHFPSSDKCFEIEPFW